MFDVFIGRDFDVNWRIDRTWQRITSLFVGGFEAKVVPLI